MKFSLKQTCRLCRANLGSDGCLFGVARTERDERGPSGERVYRPMEPCKKPTSHDDLNELCRLGGFEDEIQRWRLTNN